MVNGLVDSLKNRNTTANHNNLLINSLNYARHFLVALV